MDVTYVTEDGKTLKETELVFKDAQAVGTDYTTEQKHFNSIKVRLEPLVGCHCQHITCAISIP